MDAPSGSIVMSLEEVNAKYVKIRQSGHGVHGMVWCAHDVEGNVRVALKLVNIGDGDEERSRYKRPAVSRELAALRKIRDDHVVRLDKVIWCAPFVYMVLNYVAFTLEHFLMNYPSISDESRRFTKGRFFGRNDAIRFARGMFRGLAACHAAKIVHLDIRPANLLITDTSSPELIIADFSNAHSLDDETPVGIHRMCALPYRSPEHLLGDDELSTLNDVWSAGVVLLTMAAAGRHPIQGEKDFDYMLRLFQFAGTPTPPEWHNVHHMPNWSALIPIWPPYEHIFDDVREFGLEDVARRSFAIVPSKRWEAAALAEALTRESAEEAEEANGRAATPS